MTMGNFGTVVDVPKETGGCLLTRPLLSPCMCWVYGFGFSGMSGDECSQNCNITTETVKGLQCKDKQTAGPEAPAAAAKSNLPMCSSVNSDAHATHHCCREMSRHRQYFVKQKHKICEHYLTLIFLSRVLIKYASWIPLPSPRC